MTILWVDMKITALVKWRKGPGAATPKSVSSGASNTDPRRFATSPVEDHAEIRERPEQSAKNFAEDEGRETGVVKSHVYHKLVISGGGWKLWIALFTLLALFESTNFEKLQRPCVSLVVC